VHVELRLYNVRTKTQAFGKSYDGSAANPRLYAHTISDELHMSQRGLRGVARTKLAFASDRDGERITGTVENRGGKEIYIADYDGANQKRLTVNRTLNVFPTWSPDARSIAYTSFKRVLPNIFISNIYQGTMEELTKGTSSNTLAVWSPDGTKLCFASNRDGNLELYVVNRDGSNLRRLTNHPAADTVPTWSPSARRRFTGWAPTAWGCAGSPCRSRTRTDQPGLRTAGSSCTPPGPAPATISR
jgi:TolB protein